MNAAYVTNELKKQVGKIETCDVSLVHEGNVLNICNSFLFPYATESAPTDLQAPTVLKIERNVILTEENSYSDTIIPHTEYETHFLLKAYIRILTYYSNIS